MDFCKMKCVAVLLSFSAVIVGCDGLDSKEDAKAKETLVGSWYNETKDPSERQIKTVFTLTSAGTFSARERITGEPNEEKSSGPWYVTDGLLKLQTNEIDGKKLGTLESLFFTCKLVDLNSREFACVQANGGRRFLFLRVPSDYALS
ncbi:hypothetical protein [Polaromonas aquatica]|uniref:hypothetical protein n=1 Tax=Polaromonas aquatica TaxID=332657 RepID=UPI003D64A1BE